MERWMKEKASKSLGGASMSKFLEESERKRIARLKNMKSALSKSSYNKHANSWTRNNVEKRHKEIKLKKKKIATNRRKLNETGQPMNIPEFQLSNLCDKEVRTKSGLLIPKKRSRARRTKARKTHQDTSSKRDYYIAGQVTKSSSAFEFVSDEAEGKENCSPKSSTNRMTKGRQRPGPSRCKPTNAQKQENSNNKIDSKRNCSDGCSIQVISDEIPKECKKIEDRLSHRQSNNKALAVIKIGGGAKTIIKKKTDIIKTGMPKSSRLLHSNSNQGAKKGLKANNNNNKSMSTTRSHIPQKESIQKKKTVCAGSNRGASMESLSKEKREAMRILKDLDQNHFGAKLSAMKSSMNNLVGIPKHDIDSGTRIRVEDFDNCSFESSSQDIDTNKSPHSQDNYQRDLHDDDRIESIVGERSECSFGSSARSDKGGGQRSGNIVSGDAYSSTFESDKPSSISTRKETCNDIQHDLDTKLRLDSSHHQEDDFQAGSASSSSSSSLPYRRFDDEVIMTDSNESTKFEENEQTRTYEHDLESTLKIKENYQQQNDYQHPSSFNMSAFKEDIADCNVSVKSQINSSQLPSPLSSSSSYQADDENVLDTASFGNDSSTKGNQDLDVEASAANGSFRKMPTPYNQECDNESRLNDASKSKKSAPNNQEFNDEISTGNHSIGQDYRDEASVDSTLHGKKFATENQDVDYEGYIDNDYLVSASRLQEFQNEDSDDEQSYHKESTSTSLSPSANEELEQPSSSSSTLYQNTAFESDENNDSFRNSSTSDSSPVVCGEVADDDSFESMDDDEKSFRVESWFNNK